MTLKHPTPTSFTFKLQTNPSLPLPADIAAVISNLDAERPTADLHESRQSGSVRTERSDAIPLIRLPIGVLAGYAVPAVQTVLRLANEQHRTGRTLDRSTQSSHFGCVHVARLSSADCPPQPKQGHPVAALLRRHLSHHHAPTGQQSAGDRWLCGRRTNALRTQPRLQYIVLVRLSSAGESIDRFAKGAP